MCRVKPKDSILYKILPFGFARQIFAPLLADCHAIHRIIIAIVSLLCDRTQRSITQASTGPRGVNFIPPSLFSESLFRIRVQVTIYRRLRMRNFYENTSLTSDPIYSLFNLFIFS